MFAEYAIDKIEVHVERVKKMHKYRIVAKKYHSNEDWEMQFSTGSYEAAKERLDLVRGHDLNPSSIKLQVWHEDFQKWIEVIGAER